MKTIERKDNDIDAIKGSNVKSNAIANLNLVMGDVILFDIMEKAIAEDIWDSLIKLYEVKLPNRRIFLKEKLYISLTFSCKSHQQSKNIISLTFSCKFQHS